MESSNVTNEVELASTNLTSKKYFDLVNTNNAVASWPAIFAGATAAAALSLILLLLGAGLGLSSISPWAHKGVSASAFGISTIVWLSVTQILAAGMGGYLAGRLRTRWAGVHTDEVYFRDTAHGFLAWAVATLATVILLTSTIGSIVSGAANLTSDVATTAAVAGAAASQSNQPNNPINAVTGKFDYFVDSLFRKDSALVSATSVESSSVSNESTQKTIPALEVTRIFINSLDAKTLPPADITHVGQLVSSNTGLTQQEAEKRVSDVYSNLQKMKVDTELAAKQAAEKARKATIYATLWLFVSLLIGAFSASLAATWGGRSRDADFINQTNSY